MNQPPASVLHGVDHYGLRPEASEFPMMLVLSFVYPCNALCPHCPYTNSNIRKEYRDAPYMPKATYKKIADESGRYGAYLRISGGGEPMLHPQATELLVYAKNVGCKIGLITNGSLFDEANSRALLDTRVDIDAVEKYWVDGIGMDYLIKRKFLTWGTNTTLDASSSADPAAYLNTDEMPCPFIFERLNIDSRGNVMVCGYDISGHTSMGNVNTDSIRDIWHGEGFRFYRDKHLAGRGKDIALCAGCPDWKYRSWQHNYWKVVKNAEAARERTLHSLGEHDDLGVIDARTNG